MANEHLYQGVVVVIDDQINGDKEKDVGIGAIINKIEEQDIPCLKLDALPSTGTLKHFSAINFVVLDWMLEPVGMKDGSKLGDAGKTAIYEANIKFIKELCEFCFAPVFIFTNENPEVVISMLKEAELYSEDESRNFILVKRKSDLKDGTNLFDAVEGWIIKSSSVYTMKTWASFFARAKTDTFWHLFKRSPIWPGLLWEAFNKDDVDESHSINETLNRLIKARMDLFELEESKIKVGDDVTIDAKEMTDVVTGTMYIADDKIPPDSIEPGDIYKIEGQLYMNVRPICDTILKRVDGQGQPVFDGMLHLLKGEPLDANSKEFKQARWSKRTGLIDKMPDVLVFGLDDNEFVSFSFKDLEIKPFEENRTFRICRLLPPYSVNAQQKFASYSQRVGLPRIPDRMIQHLVDQPKQDKVVAKSEVIAVEAKSTTDESSQKKSPGEAAAIG